MRTRLALVFTMLPIGFALGCSANVGADPTLGTEQRLTVVEVLAHQTGGSERLETSARFVSVREPGSTSDALELLGRTWPTLASGTCLRLEATPTPTTSSARVDLRDLSPVAFSLTRDDGSLRAMTLEPRAFPDVMGLISGVVFVGKTEGDTARVSRLAISTANGQSVEGLELPELPARLDLVGTSTIGDVFTAGDSFDLATSPIREGDRVLVDFARNGVTKARCVVDPSGKVHIGLRDLVGFGEVSMTLRAQRRLVRDDTTLGLVDTRLERDLELKVQVR